MSACQLANTAHTHTCSLFDLCKRYNFSNVSKSLYPSLTILNTGLWQSLWIWILKVRKGGGGDTNQFRICWLQTTNHEITTVLNKIFKVRSENRSRVQLDQWRDQCFNETDTRTYNQHSLQLARRKWADKISRVKLVSCAAKIPASCARH